MKNTKFYKSTASVSHIQYLEALFIYNPYQISTNLSHLLLLTKLYFCEKHSISEKWYEKVLLQNQTLSWLSHSRPNLTFTWESLKNMERTFMSDLSSYQFFLSGGSSPQSHNHSSYIITLTFGLVYLLYRPPGWGWNEMRREAVYTLNPPSIYQYL